MSVYTHLTWLLCVALIISKAQGKSTVEKGNSKKRCGVEDHGISDHSRFRRSAVANEHWNQTTITYRVINGPYDSSWLSEPVTLSKARVEELVDQAFAEWAPHCGLHFERWNGIGARADIMISFERKNHGDGQSFDGRGKVLAHADYPYRDGSDVHFDNDENWIEEDDDKADGTIFYPIALHEIGHALGLRHSYDANTIMYGAENSHVRHLAFDDMMRMRTLYGITGHIVIGEGTTTDYVHTTYTTESTVIEDLSSTTTTTTEEEPSTITTQKFPTTNTQPSTTTTEKFPIFNKQPSTTTTEKFPIFNKRPHTTTEKLPTNTVYCHNYRPEHCLFLQRNYPFLVRLFQPTQNSSQTNPERQSTTTEILSTTSTEELHSTMTTEPTSTEELPILRNQNYPIPTLHDLLRLQNYPLPTLKNLPHHQIYRSPTLINLPRHQNYPLPTLHDLPRHQKYPLPTLHDLPQHPNYLLLTLDDVPRHQNYPLPTLKNLPRHQNFQLPTLQYLLRHQNYPLPTLKNLPRHQNYPLPTLKNLPRHQNYLLPTLKNLPRHQNYPLPTLGT